MRTQLSLCLIASLLLFSASESFAQQTAGIVELHAEALAGGVSVTLPAESTWSVGVDISLGKHLGLDLLDVDDQLNLIGVGYPVVTFRPDARWQVSLAPIGFAGVVGNDFATFYPSGRLGIGHFWDRLGVGTEFRVVRIAGGFGTGTYWLHWSLVRVSFRL